VPCAVCDLRRTPYFATGKSDADGGAPITVSTVIPIGSVTKQFTAAAILQLRDAGKLTLDDEITKWLPDFETRGSKVTLRHLLGHTSGIVDLVEMPELRAMQMMRNPRSLATPSTGSSVTISSSSPPGRCRPTATPATGSSVGAGISDRRGLDPEAAPHTEKNPTCGVIGPRGELTSRVVIPARSRVVGFGRNGAVHIVRMDDDDLQYLQCFRNR